MALDLPRIVATLQEWREQITNENNHLILDFETYYDAEYSIRKKDMTYIKYISDPRFKFQSMAYGIGRNGDIEYVEDKYVEEACKDLFAANKDLVLCGQNLMFDGMAMAMKLGIKPKFYIDLLGMDNACYPHEREHNLAAIVKRLFPDRQDLRKGNDLHLTMGVKELTPFLHSKLKPYNIDDIRITREPLYKYLDEGFPVDELLIQDLLLKMYCNPPFKADVPLLEKTYMEAKIKQDDAIDAALDFMQDHAPNPLFFVSKDSRPMEYKTKKAYEEWYRTEFAGLPPINKDEEYQKFLSSNDKFVYYLRAAHNIPVPLKPSPTPNDPENETWALAKDDVEFQRLIADYRDLEVVWEGRLLSKSNMDKTRAETLLFNASVCDGWLAIPIKYGAAHTHRFGGGEKVNPQNFGRGSNHRLALLAPEGYKVSVADSSNIEARLNAWFCDFEEKLQMFRDGGDPYNDMASEIFGYEVDRKLKDETGKEIMKLEGMVGKATDLGCGYQMGAARFRNYLNAGPLGMPPIFLEDVEALASIPEPYEYVIKTYRRKNYAIRNMWKRLESVLYDMQDGVSYDMNGITIGKNCIRLPSGLYLQYPYLKRRKQVINGDESYGWSYLSKTGLTNIFGGKLLENIIQSLARCLICEQMLWVAAHISHYGGRVAMQVHDEIISIVPDEFIEEVQKDIEELMKIPSHWCATIPLNSDGGYDVNYSK